MDDRLIPPFDTKTAIVVRDDLEMWQRLNVTGFLATGLAAAYPYLVGAEYRDADGCEYHRLLGVPMLVFEGTGEQLRASRDRASRRGQPLAIYTSDMFHTGHDEANRATVAAVAGHELDLVGLALHGPKNGVDKILKGTHLHP